MRPTLRIARNGVFKFSTLQKYEKLYFRWQESHKPFAMVITIIQVIPDNACFFLNTGDCNLSGTHKPGEHSKCESAHSQAPGTFTPSKSLWLPDTSVHDPHGVV
jgi:hypothetical protein